MTLQIRSERGQVADIACNSASRATRAWALAINRRRMELGEVRDGRPLEATRIAAAIDLKVTPRKIGRWERGEVLPSIQELEFCRRRGVDVPEVVELAVTTETKRREATYRQGSY